MTENVDHDQVLKVKVTIRELLVYLVFIAVLSISKLPLKKTLLWFIYFCILYGFITFSEKCRPILNRQVYYSNYWKLFWYKRYSVKVWPFLYKIYWYAFNDTHLMLLISSSVFSF